MALLGFKCDSLLSSFILLYITKNDSISLIGIEKFQTLGIPDSPLRRLSSPEGLTVSSSPLRRLSSGYEPSPDTSGIKPISSSGLDLPPSVPLRRLSSHLEPWPILSSANRKVSFEVKNMFQCSA